MNDIDANKLISNMISNFCEQSSVEFNERVSLWKTDFACNEVHEVIGSLISRQVVIAQNLALCPQNWSGHIAPLFLRAMADVHITIVWILREPKTRSRKYICYGLGQQKLQLEHKKSEVSSRSAIDGEMEWINAVENWIEEQRATFLTEVNLGSWSGLNTRAMAEEAGCLDFYNYVYSPFSSCVHSMWQHVSIYNLVQCENPLHRLHHVAAIIKRDPDLHYFYLASKYLQKSFASFDEAVGLKIKSPSAFNELCMAFEQLKRQPSTD